MHRTNRAGRLEVQCDSCGDWFRDHLIMPVTEVRGGLWDRPSRKHKDLCEKCYDKWEKEIH